MRWLVTGKNGMLATDLATVIRASGGEVIAADRTQLDITSQRDVNQIAGVNVVANCAAWTNVDEAEVREADAFKINALGPQLLAAQCAKIGARLVHFSTDYVFSGNNTQPYRANDSLTPLGAYGRTKAAGEWAIRTNCSDYLILRTAWLYGARGKCFPKTMANLLTTRRQVQVVTDQVGQPTWTVDAAKFCLGLVEAKAASGIYHATSSGHASWFEFATEISTSLGTDPQNVLPTTAAAFASKVPRPTWSVLAHDELSGTGVPEIGNWRERWQAAAPQILRDFLDK